MLKGCNNYLDSLLPFSDAGAVMHTHSKHAVLATLFYPGTEFRISHQEMMMGIIKGLKGGFWFSNMLKIIKALIYKYMQDSANNKENNESLQRMSRFKFTDLLRSPYKEEEQPRYEKTCLRGFRPGKTQPGLLSYRSQRANIEIRDITLSRQRSKKALISLRGCAGWSAPLLFAYDTNRCSHDVAHMDTQKDCQESDFVLHKLFLIGRCGWNTIKCKAAFILLTSHSTRRSFYQIYDFTTIVLDLSIYLSVYLSIYLSFYLSIICLSINTVTTPERGLLSFCIFLLSLSS